MVGASEGKGAEQEAQASTEQRYGTAAFLPW